MKKTVLPPMKTGKEMLRIYISGQIGDLLNILSLKYINIYEGSLNRMTKDFNKIAIAALRDKIKEIQESPVD